MLVGIYFRDLIASPEPRYGVEHLLDFLFDGGETHRPSLWVKLLHVSAVSLFSHRIAALLGECLVPVGSTIASIIKHSGEQMVLT